MQRRARKFAWSVVVASFPALIACGGGDSQSEVRVFAASSLTDAFTDLGQAFEKAHAGSRVTFNFGASSALATQINEGAPADVFASADEAQMKVVTGRANAADSRVFATNVPVLVLPSRGGPVSSFPDLAKPGVKLVLAAPGIPIGRYSRDILKNASTSPDGISADFSESALANLKSNEPNVRGVLAKVQLGEADAGIVYQTDLAAAAGDVTAIAIPENFNVAARYPIAIVSRSDKRDLASAFVAFVLSPAGQSILHAKGFGAP